MSPVREPRHLGPVNWVGLWTLYLKEVERFLKVGLQAVVAPVVTTLLFLMVFTVAIGGEGRGPGDVPFQAFLGPGLIMMAIVQNSFANTSASILISKIQGNIVDLLMPPLSHHEMVLGFAAGGVTRGMMVAVAVALGIWAFGDMRIAHPWAVAYFAVSASLLMSLVGLIGGIWADKFDHMAAVTNFIVTPLAFLSGTFYSVDRLPAPFAEIARHNPIFYMIDGLRWGCIDHADGSILTGAIVLAALNVALWLTCLAILKSGWKLKALSNRKDR